MYVGMCRYVAVGMCPAILFTEAACYLLSNGRHPHFMTSSPKELLGVHFGRIANEPAPRHVVALLRSLFSY